MFIIIKWQNLLFVEDMVQGENMLHNLFLGVALVLFPTSLWDFNKKTLIFSLKYPKKDSHM
jgi:hypothetical protein